MNSSRFTQAIIVAVAFLFAVPTSNCQAANYVLDSSHTSLIFGVSHFGYSFTYGRFNTIAGTFRFEKDAPTEGGFKFEIDTSSVDTNDAERDERLRGTDFFDVKQFPKITFKSTSVREATEGLEMVGNCGFSGQVLVQRGDFGLTAMAPMIGDDVAITFSFEGIRK